MVSFYLRQFHSHLLVIAFPISKNSKAILFGLFNLGSVFAALRTHFTSIYTCLVGPHGLTFYWPNRPLFAFCAYMCDLVLLLLLVVSYCKQVKLTSSISFSGHHVTSNNIIGLIPYFIYFFLYSR